MINRLIQARWGTPVITSAWGVVALLWSVMARVSPLLGNGEYWTVVVLGFVVIYFGWNLIGALSVCRLADRAVGPALVVAQFGAGWSLLALLVWRNALAYWLIAFGLPVVVLCLAVRELLLAGPVMAGLLDRPPSTQPSDLHPNGVTDASPRQRPGNRPYHNANPEREQS
jgi:hypothetical protein